MPAPGRNEPCPCGSGKKFKHCCLAKAQTHTGITRDDRSAAMAALMHHLRRPEFDLVVPHAALLWAAEDFGDNHQAALQSIANHETSLAAFFEWLFFDLRLDDGRTAAEWFVADRRSALGPRAVDYIRLMQGTHLRPYQVRAVRRREGFDVRDLWTDEPLAISERAATESIVVWDILIARLSVHDDGSRQIEGTALSLPPEDAPELLTALKREHRAWAKAHEGEGLERFFKDRAPIFHDLWHAHVAAPPRPHLHTAEGHAFTVSTLTFRRPLAGNIVAALDAQPDFEIESDVGGAPDTLVWLEPGTSPARLLGRVTCQRTTLVFETWSRERATRGRARLEDVLGPLTLVTEQHDAIDPSADVHATRQARPRDVETPGDRALDDEARRLADTVLAQMDRAWLDTPIPALDGETPRAAARTRRLRPRLVRLLQTVENRAARAALHGQDRDVSWMWAELGLERERRRRD